jgi:hypothetical protein
MRARPFTRSEGRLRAPGQNQTIGARATGGFELHGSSRGSQPRTSTRQGQRIGCNLIYGQMPALLIGVSL